MPDPQPKLVKVDGLGVVKFPASMSDDKIIAAIRQHKGKTHDLSRPGAGLSTEESERTRQTKDAQPLSSAIPKWATDPLLPKVTSAGNAVDDFLTRGFTYYEKLAKDAGYDGILDPDYGTVAAFKPVPVASLTSVRSLIEEAKSRNPANNMVTIP